MKKLKVVKKGRAITPRAITGFSFQDTILPLLQKARAENRPIQVVVLPP